jgi:hypothetical protein
MAIKIHDADLLMPGAAELARLHAAELPQKDELCGCFWTLLALRLADVAVPDQDAVAVAAGSALSTGDDHAGSLPRGETGRRDYRLELPAIEDEDRSGTATGGVVRAVDELSDGHLSAVPVSGPWTADTVVSLLKAAAAEEEATLLFNVATKFLWGSRPPVSTLLGYLADGDDAAGPGADWTVGHFVGCFGAVRGRQGTLAIIGDTYPSLGVGAVHLQPVERLAAALRRDGMASSGGALIVVPAARARALFGVLSGAGLTVGVWDNGSIDVRAAATPA